MYIDQDTHVGEKSDFICIVVVGVQRMIFIFFISFQVFRKFLGGNLDMGLPVHYLG